MTTRELSKQQINQDLSSGARFMKGVGTIAVIRRIMVDAGYVKAEHEYGWTRYFYLMGYTWNVPLIDPNEVTLAIAGLDQWDGVNFRLARAALKRLHPDQYDYIFDKLSAGTGIDSVGSVHTFITRAKVLREGTDPNREQYREEDQAAIDTLNQRNIINPEIEAELRELIGKATKFEDVPDVVENLTDTAEYKQKAREFHDWLKDWRTTARTVIKRRSYLIHLGLAKRRKSEKKVDFEW